MQFLSLFLSYGFGEFFVIYTSKPYNCFVLSLLFNDICFYNMISMILQGNMIFDWVHFCLSVLLFVLSRKP